MARNRKVKRYANIYSKRARQKKLIIRIAITAVLLAGLVVIAYFVAAGIFGNDDVQAPAESQAGASSEVSSKSAGTQAVTVDAAQIKGIQMSSQILNDESAIQDFLTQAKEDGYNTVIVPLKTSDGAVMYQSSVSQVATWGTMTENPVDAKQLVDTIQKAGLMPMAQVYAFRDAKAPNMSNENTYTKSNGNVWTDNNGNAWLNPYQASARAYICDIVKELGSLGYGRVLVDGAQFPSGITTSVMGNNKLTQEQILEQFNEELAQTGVPFVTSYYWDTLTNGTSKKLYGGDPTTYTGTMVIAPIINVTAYPDGVKTGSSTASTADDIAQYVIGKAQNAASQGVTILPQIAPEQNVKLTAQGLKELGIDAYLVMTE